MHVDVRDILAEPVGAHSEHHLADVQPQLDDLDLAAPIDGRVRFDRTEFGLVARGQVGTSVRLECHRCLSTFEQPVTASIAVEFSGEPDEDQLPIEKLTIDLAPPIREELLLALPLKQLCTEACAGITATPAGPGDHRLRARVRVKKG